MQDGHWEGRVTDLDMDILSTYTHGHLIGGAFDDSCRMAIGYVE